MTTVEITTIKEVTQSNYTISNLEVYRNGKNVYMSFYATVNTTSDTWLFTHINLPKPKSVINNWIILPFVNDTLSTRIPMGVQIVKHNNTNSGGLQIVYGKAGDSYRVTLEYLAE